MKIRFLLAIVAITGQLIIIEAGNQAIYWSFAFRSDQVEMYLALTIVGLLLTMAAVRVKRVLRM